MHYLYSKSARKSTRNLHKRAVQLIGSVKQVNRDLREKKVPLDTLDTRGRKERLGKVAPMVLKASRDLKASGENKGLQGRRESRDRKVKKELLVLLEQKETLDVWAHQATKALLDLKGTKETGALLVFKDQKENVLFLPKYLFLRNLSMCFLTSRQRFIAGFKGNRLIK